MAEEDRRTTPYTYTFDDPIRHTDPDGMFGEDVNGDSNCCGTLAQGPLIVPELEGALTALGLVGSGIIIVKVVEHAQNTDGTRVMARDQNLQPLPTPKPATLKADPGSSSEPAPQQTTKDNEKTGTIYKVPGSATESGKPYIGRHNKPNPQKTRKSNDGRDRKQAEVIDTYDPLKEGEGALKEQLGIDNNGGVENLDNKRNEVSEKRKKELEKKNANNGN